MADLRSTISKLAEEFAASILTAVRSASLNDLTGIAAPSRRETARPERSPSDSVRPTRRFRSTRKGSRRTANDIANLTNAIVALVAKHPDGLRAEQIQKELGLARKDVARPIQQALDAKTLRKKGAKRATRYFAA